MKDIENLLILSLMVKKFKVDKPDLFSEEEKDQFLQLLKEQGQVSNPTLERINASTLICLAFVDNNPIGIGAIKNVYKSPFDYAEVPELKEDFDHELGYIYVKEGHKKLGIGKEISRLLLQDLGSKNVFATTELSDENSMKFILEKLSFKQIGKSYKGGKTGKDIALFVKLINSE